MGLKLKAILVLVFTKLQFMCSTYSQVALIDYRQVNLEKLLPLPRENNWTKSKGYS